MYCHSGSYRRDIHITCFIVQSPDDVCEERERERERETATPRGHAPPAQTRSPYV
jgi:hypothetical protein